MSELWLGLGVLGVVIAVAAIVIMIVAEKSKVEQSKQSETVHFKVEGLEDIQRNSQNTFCNKYGGTVTVTDDLSVVNCVLCLEMFERLSKTLPFKHRLAKYVK